MTYKKKTLLFRARVSFRIFYGCFGVAQKRPDQNPQNIRVTTYILLGILAGVKELLRRTVMTTTPFPAPAGYRWVFCKSFKHWRSGKDVFPKKSDSFCFLVKA